MTKTKFIALGLVMVTFFCFLTSCSTIRYNAVMYSKSEEWILTSFLEDNKVRGAYYKNPDYTGNPYGSVEKYYYDETSPGNRTFIIDNKDTYDTIFKANTLSVDFDKEVIYLYIFPDVSPSRKYFIDNILLEGEQLSIYYKLEKSEKMDATMPYQRCLIVVMKKTDASNVKFIKQR